MKYSKYISGGLMSILVLSVFVSFSVDSGEEFLGQLRKTQINTTKATACVDSDAAGSTYLNAKATNPEARIPGQTYGTFGTVGPTLNSDTCVAGVLKEYYCSTTTRQVREEINCADMGLSCKTNSEGLGYCG